MATDNFNRADAGDLGANWSELSGFSGTSVDWDIVSNAAQIGNVNVDIGLYNNTVTPAANQYSQCKITTLPNSGAIGTGIGPVVRGSTSVQSLYGAVVASGGGVSLFGFTSGTYNEFGQSSAGAIVANDILQIEVSGTSPAVLTVKKNTNADGTGGTIIQIGGNDTTSDSASPLASGNVGIFHSSTSGGTPTIDDWAGGDSAAVGKIAYQPNYLRAPILAQ